MDIVERIFELLKEQEIEQKEFAALVGVSPSKVSEWKLGKAKSYTKYMPQIAEALGTTTEYLLTGTGPKKKTSTSVDQKHHIPDEETLKLLELLETREDIRYLAAASERATPEHVRATAMLFDEMYGRDKDK